jgi:hypothetical protein
MPATLTANSPLTKSEVAALSHSQIAQLSTSDMLRVIEAAELPFARKTGLAHQSPEALRRLTHLACRSCRNQGY